MKVTPMKAIRAKCLDCAGGSCLEVRTCDLVDCPLHPYRYGKRPETVERKEHAKAGKQGTNGW